MLERTELLEALDRRWESRTYHGMDYSRALERFTALWNESLRLRDERERSWREDLEADLSIARAVNGHPAS